MKERPILFSGPMVRAILEGRKTQTRRVVKNINPHTVRVVEKDATEYVCHTRAEHRLIESITGRHFEARGPVCLDRPDPKECAYHTLDCPHGSPGDRLWVREAFRPTGDNRGERVVDSWPGKHPHELGGVIYRATNPDGIVDFKGGWKPSIFMPRWASRITLEVTGIRCERLQEITEDDAIAEGCPPNVVGVQDMTPSAQFRDLWCKINGPESWERNPWVWVVEFKRIEP